MQTDFRSGVMGQIYTGSVDTRCFTYLRNPLLEEHFAFTYPVMKEQMAFVTRKGGANLVESGLRVLTVFSFEMLALLLATWLTVKTILALVGAGKRQPSTSASVVDDTHPSEGRTMASKSLNAMYAIGVVFFAGLYQTSLVTSLMNAPLGSSFT